MRGFLNLIFELFLVFYVIFRVDESFFFSFGFVLYIFFII